MTTTYDATYETEVLQYFARKADQYDLVDEQVYWRLSDRLLGEVLDEQVLAGLPADFRFMDAGGGTGRWTARILERCPQARGVLYDLSSDMAAKAREKAERGGFSDRLEVINAPLEEAGTHLEEGSFDLIFNFHNVLGFVQDVEGVIEQLARLLRPGGLFLSFVPNRYHTMFFNIFVGNIDEAEHVLESGRGRFTTDMPYMHVFTAAELSETYRRAGLRVTLATGFPNLIYPGFQETQLRGQTASLAGILSTADNFERIYRMEKRVLGEPGVVSRGNNLFVLGQRVAENGHG